MRRRVPLALVLSALITWSSAFAEDPPIWKRYVVSQPEVVVPAVVKRTGMQGHGIFRLSINPKDGSVSEVKVLKHTGYQKLDAIYVLNFFQWKFQPGTITTATIARGIRITGRANIYH